ncbi:hypothetical protein XELAEV_18014573mg [Xenopus laevis]|uniref:Uncharacterized protein n=1 Tax=Xenopus laevis TaxID=8355 RepID=A0A974HV32_XENLA|nr:hypothetical protein XELAEV_18014573mg [Xenopus laevis]
MSPSLYSPVYNNSLYPLCVTLLLSNCVRHSHGSIGAALALPTCSTNTHIRCHCLGTQLSYRMYSSHSPHPNRAIAARSPIPNPIAQSSLTQQPFAPEAFCTYLDGGQLVGTVLGHNPQRIIPTIETIHTLLAPDTPP